MAGDAKSAALPSKVGTAVRGVTPWRSAPGKHLGASTGSSRDPMSWSDSLIVVNLGRRLLVTHENMAGFTDNNHVPLRECQNCQQISDGSSRTRQPALHLVTTSFSSVDGRAWENVERTRHSGRSQAASKGGLFLGLPARFSHKRAESSMLPRRRMLVFAAPDTSSTAGRVVGTWKRESPNAVGSWHQVPAVPVKRQERGASGDANQPPRMHGLLAGRTSTLQHLEVAKEPSFTRQRQLSSPHSLEGTELPLARLNESPSAPGVPSGTSSPSRNPVSAPPIPHSLSPNPQVPSARVFRHPPLFSKFSDLSGPPPESDDLERAAEDERSKQQAAAATGGGGQTGGTHSLTMDNSGPAFMGRVFAMCDPQKGLFAVNILKVPEATHEVHFPPKKPSDVPKLVAEAYESGVRWILKQLGGDLNSYSSGHGVHFYFDKDSAAAHVALVQGLAEASGNDSLEIQRSTVGSCSLDFAYKHVKDAPPMCKFVPEPKQVRAARQLLRKEKGSQAAEDFQGVPVFMSDNLTIAMATPFGIRWFTPFFFDKRQLDALIGSSVDQHFAGLQQTRRAQRRSAPIGFSPPSDAGLESLDPDNLNDPAEVAEFMREMGQVSAPTESLLARVVHVRTLDWADAAFLGTKWGRKLLGLQPMFPILVDSFERRAAEAEAVAARDRATALRRASGMTLGSSSSDTGATPLALGADPPPHALPRESLAAAEPQEKASGTPRSDTLARDTGASPHVAPTPQGDAGSSPGASSSGEAVGAGGEGGRGGVGKRGRELAGAVRRWGEQLKFGALGTSALSLARGILRLPTEESSGGGAEGEDGGDGGFGEEVAPGTNQGQAGGQLKIVMFAVAVEGKTGSTGDGHTSSGAGAGPEAERSSEDRIQRAVEEFAERLQEVDVTKEQHSPLFIADLGDASPWGADRDGPAQTTVGTWEEGEE